LVDSNENSRRTSSSSCLDCYPELQYQLDTQHINSCPCMPQSDSPLLYTWQPRQRGAWGVWRCRSDALAKHGRRCRRTFFSFFAAFFSAFSRARSCSSSPSAASSGSAGAAAPFAASSGFGSIFTAVPSRSLGGGPGSSRAGDLLRLRRCRRRCRSASSSRSTSLGLHAVLLPFVGQQADLAHRCLFAPEKRGYFRKSSMAW
jgi:hypothetical protein